MSSSRRRSSSRTPSKGPDASGNNNANSRASSTNPRDAAGGAPATGTGVVNVIRDGPEPVSADAPAGNAAGGGGEEEDWDPLDSDE